MQAQSIPVTDELAFASALELAKLIREHQVSPVELMELYLGRIDRLNPQLSAYLTVASELALEGARRAEAAFREEDLPPFHGVPVAIKDLNDTAGIRTTYGSRMFSNHVPDADDAVVARLKAGGFIVIGKTYTPEFGTSLLVEGTAFPACRNPWDLGRTPGASSGGSAASVAAGLSPIAQGSDAGGSVRMPASCCGVVGLKPSRGRISHAPRASDLHWTSGPLTRTVADAAAMLDVLAGYEVGDGWWTPPPPRPFLTEAGSQPERLHIAFSTGGVDVAPGNRAALEAAGKLLIELGHSVEEDDPGEGWAIRVDELDVAAPLLAGIGVEVLLWPGMPPLDRIDLDMFDACTRMYLESAPSVKAIDSRASQISSLKSARRILPFFERYDVFLTPAVAQPPLVFESYRDSSIAEQVRAWLSFQPFQSMWNRTGQPAISLPLHIDELGLPAGVQLVGRPADEATLIRLSAQLEEASPWRHLRPPVS